MSFEIPFSADEIMYSSIEIKNKKNETYVKRRFNEVVFGGEFQDCRFVGCIFLNCVFKFTEFNNSVFENCKFSNLIANFSSEGSVFDTCVFKTMKILSGLEMLQEGYSDERINGTVDEYERDRLLNKQNKQIASLFKSLFLYDCKLGNFDVVTPREFTANIFGDTNLGSFKLDSPRKVFDICFDKETKVKAEKGLKLPSYKDLKKHNVSAYIKPNKVGKMRKTFRWGKRLVIKLMTRGKFGINYCEKEHNMWMHFLGQTGTSYLIIANYFETEKDYESYSYYFYNSKKLSNLSLKTRDRAKNNLVDMMCGYGEKWERGLYFSLISIFMFAFIYMSGLEVNADYSINYTLTTNLNIFNTSYWIEFARDYWHCLYFSMMTFTTVGYGNMQASSFASQVFSFIQMFLGIVIMTITTGSLLRKILR